MNNKNKELTINEIRNLKNNSQVYIVYLDEEKFNLEYCRTVPINIYYNNIFIDNDGNSFTMDEVIDYVSNGSIKVYSTYNTITNKFKLTNYERIKNMTVKEMAMSRIYSNQDKNGYFEWYGDFKESPTNSYSDAVKMELTWLNSEVNNE